MLKMLLHYLQKIKKKVLKAANHLVSRLQVPVTPKCSDKAGLSSGGKESGGTAIPQRSSRAQKSTTTGSHHFSAEFCAIPIIPCSHLCCLKVAHHYSRASKRASGPAGSSASSACCGQARTCLSAPSSWYQPGGREISLPKLQQRRGAP